VPPVLGNANAKDDVGVAGEGAGGEVQQAEETDDGGVRGDGDVFAFTIAIVIATSSRLLKPSCKPSRDCLAAEDLEI